MKSFYAVLGLTLGLIALPSQAETLDVNISSNALAGDFSGPVARALPGTVGQYDFGLISRPHHDNGLFQAHAGLLLTGDAGAQNIDLTVGLGARLIYASVAHERGGAGALGGQFEARLPQFNRLGLSGYTYFAPRITTIHSLNRYWENALSLEYEVIRGGNIYVGYRNVHVNVDNAGSFSADNGFHAGFRLKF